MQYQVMITITDAADVFELADLLAPIKGNEKIKFAQATPRPTPPTTPNAGVGGTPAAQQLAARRAAAAKPTPLV